MASNDLSALQRDFLRAFFQRENHFFLTGGAALVGFHLGHRETHDLDVSSKLKLKLSGADEAKVTKTSTANPEAYQAYLKGRYYWNRRTAETLKKAIEQFKAATDRDPNYAMAYVGLADCYLVLPQYAGTPASETMPQAKVVKRSRTVGRSSFDGQAGT